MPPAPPPAARLLAVLAPALVAIWLGLGVWSYTVDDSFISLRYSWNFIHGDGLVFNLGERVEGYSNPTWVLLLAPFVGLGLDGEWVAKVLGLGFHAATAAAVAWGSIRAGERLATPPGEGAWARLVVGAAAGGLAAWTLPSLNWAVLALETPMYSAFLLGSFVLLLHDSPRAPYVAAGLAGLAGISRPEGPLQAAMLGLSLVVLTTRGWRPAALWAAGARPAVLVIAPVLSWAAFRWFYYQDIVPNTWYHKGGGAEWAEVQRYVQPLLTNETVFFAAGLFGLALAWLADRRLGAALSLVLAGHTLFVLRVGGDWMPNQRFAAPGLPFVALAVGAGLSATLSVAPRGPARAAFAAAALVIAALHGAQALPDRMAALGEDGQLELTARTERDDALLAPGRGFSGSNHVVALWALERVRDGQALAYSEVGLVAYLSELRVIDLVGLTDKYMAGATGLDNDGRVQWLQDQRPEWLLLRTGGVIPIRKLRGSAWVMENYDIVPGPKAYQAARRKDIAPATVAEALANLERAVARQPRFPAFVDARDRLAKRAAAGEGAAVAAADAE